MTGMRIAVAGGTGTIGRRVAEELRARGHEVRVLSRGAPEYRVDLTTGEGLGRALEGCDVVVDAANSSSSRLAAQILVEGSRRLLAAESAAGVGHHVCVSIVGCEKVPLGYFRLKADQERVVEQGPVPWSIVRATQFHELVASTFASAGRMRMVPVPRARLQTIASSEVAGVVADVAEGVARRQRIEVAGPEVADVRELARAWRSITGTRALLLPVPLPGELGQALRAGALTADRPDVRGTTPFATWLAARKRNGGEAALTRHRRRHAGPRPEVAADDDGVHRGAPISVARGAPPRMRLLVTGGTGVLGRAFLPLAEAAGHKAWAPARAELDLFDPAAVAAVMCDVDAVLHLATRIQSLDKLQQPEAWRDNDRLRAEASSNLVDGALAADVQAYIQPTVTFVYPAGQPASEDTPIGDVPVILRSALAAEQQAERFARAGRRGVALRLGLLDGPGTGHGHPDTSLGATLGVQDAACALLAALALPSGIYNVCRDGERISNRRFVEATGWRPRR